MKFYLLFFVLIFSVLFAACESDEKRIAREDANLAAELLAEGPPEIHYSKAPFTLGGLKGEPTQDAPWWTLEYGDFPVLASGGSMTGLAERFAAEHLSWPERNNGIPFTIIDATEYTKDLFLNSTPVEGDYYDIDQLIRFEDAPISLMLMTDFSESDREFLESGGRNVIASEIARKSLIFAVPSGFLIDDLTSDQLGEILSGGITDWMAYGSDYSISLFYFQLYEYERMLKRTIMNGASLIPEIIEETVVGSDENGYSYFNSVPYDNSPGSLGIFEFSDPPEMSGVKILKIDGVLPSEETILSGEYPIFIGVYAVYWESDREGPPGRFVQWCASPEGKAIIEELGMIPV